MGNKPPAFDLLYWNSDGTRMAGTAHGWYLRNTYLENNLIKPGKVRLKGEAIDLGRIKLDAYAVGAEKDHIVPWDAAWRITQLVGGAVRFVLASSGHIAGIVNPPGARGPTGSRSPGRGPPTRNNGSRRRPATTGAGGRTGRPGCPSGPAAGSIRRRSAATPIRRWGMRPAAMCWRNRGVILVDRTEHLSPCQER